MGVLARPKYAVVAELREYGLSYLQIAEYLYPDLIEALRNAKNAYERERLRQLAKDRVRNLLRHALRKSFSTPQDVHHSDELMDSGGSQNVIDCHNVLGIKTLEKKKDNNLSREERLKYEMEQLIWTYYKLALRRYESETLTTWWIAREIHYSVHSKFLKKYGRSAWFWGGRNKPKPLHLSYVYYVLLIALFLAGKRELKIVLDRYLSPERPDVFVIFEYYFNKRR